MVLVAFLTKYQILLTQKKERLLKKQHREALLLDNYFVGDGLTSGRSLRDRKPVTYTFGKNDKFNYNCSQPFQVMVVDACITRGFEF